MDLYNTSTAQHVRTPNKTKITNYRRRTTETETMAIKRTDCKIEITEDGAKIHRIRRKKTKPYVQLSIPPTEYILDDKTILSALEEFQKIQMAKVIDELKKIDPSLSKETILKLYHKSISIRQSSVQCNGAILEKEIENCLLMNNIPFKSQVTINNEGTVIGFNKKKGKCDHVLDIVVGLDISIGRNITEFVLLSCKTTCRERWRQDDWTLMSPPARYILITTSDDYPLSSRFQESEKRMIITTQSKRNDDRIYKLNFSNLYNLVKTV